MKIDNETYRRLINNSINAKHNKYYNEETEYDGIKFQSKKERNWYIKYKLMEQAGEIYDLQRQVEFLLIEPFVLNDKKYRKTSYFADFTFYDKDNKYHVVDIKSEITRKDKVYRLKKKMMAYKYGIEIEEI